MIWSNFHCDNYFFSHCQWLPQQPSCSDWSHEDKWSWRVSWYL
jgi:hypothetical protein